MIPFVGLISYLLNYIFAQIISHDSLSTYIAYFPKTILICTNMHWVALVSFVLGSIAMYSKQDTTSLESGGEFE